MPIDYNNLPSNYFITKPANASGVAAHTELTPLGLLNAYEQHNQIDATGRAELQKQLDTLRAGGPLSPGDPNYAKADYIDGILNGKRTTSTFTKFMQGLGEAGIAATGAGAIGGYLPGSTSLFSNLSGSTALSGGTGSNFLLGDAGNDVLAGGSGSATLGGGAGGSGNFLTDLISKIPGASSLFSGSGGAGSLGNSLILSSLLSGAGQIYGANAASNAQKDAIHGANIKLEPYVNTGYTATNSLNNLLTNPQTGLENLPGYKFTKQQGLKAVQNSASARGLGVSGAAQKGAATYATGLADSTYGDQVNRLLGIATLGQNAATGVGSNIIQGGNASAANYLTQGNSAAGIGNAASTAAIINMLLKNNNNNTGTGIYG